MDARFATLSLETRQILRKAGFTSVKSVLALSPTDLSKELELDLAATYKLIEELRGPITTQKSKIENAFDMLQNHDLAGVRHITTLCRPLDLILEGGIPRRAVTELCGAPGSGKTQLCMQVAVAVTIPEACAGLEGEALYLDTEGSFSPLRAQAMASALSAHLKHQTKGEMAIPSTDEILSSIHVCRAHDSGDQLAFLRNLPHFLKTHPKVKLVVIDSVAHHFRHDFADFSQRGKILSSMAHSLNTIANDFDLVVLVTNHMTTRGDQGLVPALGEHWYHGVTNRIMLSKLDEEVEWKQPRSKGENQAIERLPVRRAEIVKASSVSSASTDFVISSIGARALKKQQTTSTETNSGQKKQRLEGEDIGTRQPTL